MKFDFDEPIQADSWARCDDALCGWRTWGRWSHVDGKKHSEEEEHPVAITVPTERSKEVCQYCGIPTEPFYDSPEKTHIAFSVALGANHMPFSKEEMYCQPRNFPNGRDDTGRIFPLHRGVPVV